MIAIGSDHGGFHLKQEIMKHLDELGLAYHDYGAYSTESCDYPAYGEAVARAVAGGECERGILVCGTGIGIGIAANKVHGIRCATCSDCYCAEMSRRHNDAGELMTHDQRHHLAARALLAMEQVQIRAADAAGRDLHQDLIGLRLRHRQVAVF